MDSSVSNAEFSVGVFFGPQRTAINGGEHRKSAPGRNRTCDLALRRHSLYPLSYRGKDGPESMDIRPLGLVEEKGIEPSTFALRTRRSPN
jgi:hypothetical protein